MATIRSYTTIEQSKVLAGFLPLESADMYYEWSNKKVHFKDDKYSGMGFSCWSLAALLCILKDYTLQTNTDGTVFVVCEGKKPIISDFYNNPVDACVDAIENLHKLSLL